jgi:uncharacterized repeat protein (TIGR01451 family)
MNKLYFLLVAILLVTATNAQIVTIPDANFKAKIIDNGFDDNADGEIQTSEALQIFSLDLDNANISSLEGINEFINLQSLSAKNNQITILDISNLNLLSDLVVSNNQINTINLPLLSTAEGRRIVLSDNELATIDFSNQNNIIALSIANNQLSNVTLPIINESDPSCLDISGNNFTSISFAEGTILTSFYCNNTQLTSLDLSNVIFNYDIHPSEIEFQIKNNPNLTFINLKNGFFERCQDDPNPPDGGFPFFCSEDNFSITNNPNLSAVCIDNGIFDYQLNYYLNYFANQPNVNVTNYCSFTPGGTFYTVLGNTRLDENANGCDTTDVTIPNQRFTITSTVSGTIISGENGSYSIPVQAGSHTLSPVLENPSYFNVAPASVTVSFPSAATPFTQNFCITPNGIVHDIEVSILPNGPARPGFDAFYKIIYKNKGNQVANGTLNFSFDDAVMDLVTANPINDGNAVNSLTWNYTNLLPFETREISLTFNINSPMEIPAVNGDDVLLYNATILIATDETPNDNSFNLNQTVVNSYDPNDKTCLEGTTITPSMVGQYVHYVIRFENTGTFAAQNVVIKDMIDTTKFDITTLVPQSSSHNFITRITNTNKVEFVFENINLPFDDANNDGYVAFKIKTKPNLVLGDMFSNSANIYFDYNFPILTNTATTTVTALGTQDFDFEKYFTVYPNPAKDVLHLETKAAIGVKELNIYNILGQMVQVVTNPENNASIDVTNLKTGTYFIKVTTDLGTANAKFIKE